MNGFTIYREYYELITLLTEKEQQELLLAITKFMFEDVEPILNDKQSKVFRNLKRPLEISKKNSLRSKGNGAPTGNKNALKKQTENKPKSNRETNQKQTHQDVNVYVNDNVNVNILEKEGYREKKPFKEIIDYLNLKTGSNYKHSTKTTQEKINARLNEGFTLDDFIVVIDKKTVEWIGTDMAKYLRPETLFGNKFESYLNQKARATTLHDIAKTEEFQKYLEEGFNE